MSLIPETQMTLMRERKQFERVFGQRNWSSVCEQEKQLVGAVNDAFTDSEKDLGLLLKEMKAVVAVYRELLDVCVTATEHSVAEFDSFRS